MITSIIVVVTEMKVKCQISISFRKKIMTKDFYENLYIYITFIIISIYII